MELLEALKNSLHHLIASQHHISIQCYLDRRLFVNRIVIFDYDNHADYRLKYKKSKCCLSDVVTLVKFVPSQYIINFTTSLVY